jgi:hypothetical protein
MDRPGHQTAQLFVGTEVEHSPAHGMTTLFVVGVQQPHEIQHYLTNNPYGIKHIYFGANQSFPTHDMTADEWRSWLEMMRPFLDQDYFCTLDLDACQVPDLMETWLVERHRFIPMISVKLPYINQLGYNATLKLDDTNFEHSNPGVWCHSIHSLQKRDVFTDWSKYTQDEVIK